MNGRGDTYVSSSDGLTKTNITNLASAAANIVDQYATKITTNYVFYSTDNGTIVPITTAHRLN
ncbi:MAG: hypothetical protein R2827_04150 [Bdellovibrionales bacterium]